MIPFNRPWSAERERQYLDQALGGPVRSGGGPFTSRCQGLLAGQLGCAQAMLTTSGTAALEMAALLLDLKPGDEVILPSFTFVSTANAFVLRGAVPVFADIRPDTLNLDERLLGALIGPRTRAVVPVHYAGVACELDPILELARRHGVEVIEDNAHGLFASYRGRPLGTFAAMSALSFHETKNFSCGEGGALLINRAGVCERAAILRDKGTDRQRFLHGQVDRYSWVDLGSSFPPSDLLAAILLSQLEARQTVMATRARLWRTYRERLAGWAERSGAVLPAIPAHCASSHHIFHLLMPDLASRRRLIGHLADRGIMAVFHYQPLHSSTMGRRFGGRPGQCPVSESVADRIVRLPLFNGMTDQEHDQVCCAAEAFRC